jgi:hypothetical protein
MTTGTRALPPLLILSVLAGCLPAPPRLPFITVAQSKYSPDGCGYDWNDMAVDLETIPRLAKEWKGPREVLMVFRLGPVPETCVARVRAIYRSLGFARVYVVSVPKPRPGDPPLMPSS